MPDWVNNYLDVRGELEEVQRFKKTAVGPNPWRRPPRLYITSPLNFHSLIPIPDEALQKPYHLAGHGWEHENWGCKWGACDSELVVNNGCELYYTFETPWNPPLDFLKSLGVLWPNLKFLLEYDNDVGPLEAFDRLCRYLGVEWPEPKPGTQYKGICKVHGNHFEDTLTTF